MIRFLGYSYDDSEVALSVVSIVELTHGVHRAKSAEQFKRRILFANDICSILPVFPLTTEVARLAGTIGAEQMGQGVRIEFADLLIGSTALHFSYDLATLNEKHFARVPGLSVIPPKTTN